MGYTFLCVLIKILRLVQNNDNLPRLFRELSIEKKKEAIQDYIQSSLEEIVVTSGCIL